MQFRDNHIRAVIECMSLPCTDFFSYQTQRTSSLAAYAGEWATFKDNESLLSLVSDMVAVLFAANTTNGQRTSTTTDDNLFTYRVGCSTHSSSSLQLLEDQSIIDGNGT